MYPAQNDPTSGGGIRHLEINVIQLNQLSTVTPTVNPASTLTTTPDMYDESSDNRKATTFPTSSGSATRLRHDRFALSVIPVPSRKPFASGVLMTPLFAVLDLFQCF